MITDKNINYVKELPGKRYYLGRVTKEYNYRVIRRKMKKIRCSDGKIRRFCDGVDDSKTFGGHCLPVICAECGYDFNFFTIYDRTMPTLITHVCEVDNVTTSS